MFVRDANEIALRICAAMAPYCERPPEVAGSIRRRVQEVKDIEIVTVAKWEVAPIEEQVKDLFGHPGKLPDNTNLLHFWAMTLARDVGVRWIKPGTKEVVPWEPKPEGKYWRGLVGEEPAAVKLDLFIARPDNYGLIKLIRTGSAEFSSAVLGHAKRNTPFMSESAYFDLHKKKGEPEGYLVERTTGKRVETREEEEVFAMLGLRYLEPRLRVDRRSLVCLPKCSECRKFYEPRPGAKYPLCDECVVKPFGKEQAAV